MKTAVFLGAGASKTEGAPLQSELFKEYFEITGRPNFMPAWPTTHPEIRAELINFFREIFGIDLALTPPEEIDFPTFEEALGVLDLAELRREGFKNYDPGNLGTSGSKIRLLRKYIVIAMAIVIHEKLNTGSGTVHRKLVGELHHGGLLQDITFISTNYDILIDNALLEFPPPESFANVNYGVEFSNFVPEPWMRPHPTASCLHKLHGSLNWLFCPTCNQLSLEAFGKIVDGLIRIPPASCWRCQSTLNPVIVPPTFFKDMSRVFLSMIWNQAEQALRQVDQIIFCGYSFPDADMHIKYLLKRTQVNRVQSTPLRFIVINGKHDDNRRWEEEERRYQRFLGEANVAYTDLDFESFCQSPQMFLRSGVASA